MKVLIPIVIGLVVVGCGKEQSTNTNDGNSAPEKPAKQKEVKETPSNNSTAKPVKELTLREKVIGSYEAKRAGTTLRYVFLEDRMFEVYMNDERKDGGTWRALGNEVFLEDKSHTLVCKIEPSGYLTEIAYIQNGKRLELSKEEQQTYKKIK